MSILYDSKPPRDKLWPLAVLKILTTVLLIRAIAAIEDPITAVEGVDTLVTASTLELTHRAVVDWKKFRRVNQCR